MAEEGSFFLGKGIILEKGSLYFLRAPRKKKMKNFHSQMSYFNYAGKGNKQINHIILFNNKQTDNHHLY